MIRYDLNGWLGVIGGPLEYIEDTIKSIKGQASQANNLMLQRVNHLRMLKKGFHFPEVLMR